MKCRARALNPVKNLAEVAHPEASQDLAPVVGKNLRRLRSKAGLSLEKLSKASGVSRAMLGQIELGQSAPTINVLWKISRALGVPFSGLISETQTHGTRVMKASDSKRLTSHDGRFQSRALFPTGEGSGVAEAPGHPGVASFASSSASRAASASARSFSASARSFSASRVTSPILPCAATIGRRMSKRRVRIGPNAGNRGG